MSEVLTEILKVDPSFDKDRFLKQCERDIIPNVLEVRWGQNGIHSFFFFSFTVEDCMEDFSLFSNDKIKSWGCLCFCSIQICTAPFIK